MRTRLIQALSLPPIYAYNLGLAGAGLVVEDGCDPSDWGEYYTSAQRLVRFLQDDGVDGLVDAFADAARAPAAAAPPPAAAVALHLNGVPVASVGAEPAFFPPSPSGGPKAVRAPAAAPPPPAATGDADVGGAPPSAALPDGADAPPPRRAPVDQLGRALFRALQLHQQRALAARAE